MTYSYSEFDLQQYFSFNKFVTFHKNLSNIMERVYNKGWVTSANQKAFNDAKSALMLRITNLEETGKSYRYASIPVMFNNIENALDLIYKSASGHIQNPYYIEAKTWTEKTDNMFEKCERWINITDWYNENI